MGYKDKEKQRGYDRERMRKVREGRTQRVEQDRVEQKALHTQSVTPDIEMFEGKPRFLKLSDGQILDRANQPSSNKHLPGMIACNRANDYRNTMSRQRRLGRLLIALDKDVTGLDGKRLNLGTQVRNGINGWTFKELKDAIK